MHTPELRIELRASCMLGRYSVELYPQQYKDNLCYTNFTVIKGEIKLLR